MKIKYSKCEMPTEKPCLMENEFGEIFLITKGINGETYVTRMNPNSCGTVTWESDLVGYKPLPAGTKIEIIN